jgi:tripartite-type tricarboxylate transporter receptor subunit TctC
VPFSSGAPATAAVVAGHIPIGSNPLAAALPQIKGGNLRALAVTSKSRSPTLPDVPTMVELGHPEIEGDSWVGVLVPAGTSKDIVLLLNREIVASIANPNISDHLATLGFEPVGSTPQQFADQIKIEIETWGKVIRAADIKAE